MLFYSRLLEQARLAGVVEEMVDGDIRWLRFQDDFRGLDRGTVVLGDRFVFAYPHIPRLTSLVGGIRRFIHRPYVVEEKIDGYNVRVVMHEGRLLAFTRGGFLCPFTMDRLPDFLSPEFFEDYRDAVLIVEVAGPDNPYIEVSPPNIEEDIQMFALDVMEEDAFWDPLRRHEVLEAYGLLQPRRWGPFSPDEPQKALEVLRLLDGETVEGMVLKEPREVLGHQAYKYYTPRATLRDLAADSDLLFELPPEFFISRIQRLGIALAELGEVPDEELFRDLGESLLSGFFEVIRRYPRKRSVTHTLTVRVHDERTVDKLMEQFSRSRVVRVREVNRRVGEDGLLHVTFEKTYMRATSILNDWMKGSTVIE